MPISAPAVPGGVEERWAEVSGHRMRYLAGGRGRPLVLIHGLLGYSFSWRFNLPILAEHATVYAPDLLGTGFSDRAGLDCSFRAIAEQVKMFIDQLGLTDYDLLGTSHGGAVAVMLAALDPKPIRRLLLCAPANPWAPRGRWLAPLLGNPPLSVLVPSMTRIHLLREFQLRRMYGDVRRIAPGTMAGYSAPFELPGTIEHALRILRGWRKDMSELRRTLPAVAALPTLLMWGNRDRIVAPASIEPIKANFRAAELIVFDGAGHLPYEEVPEPFNRAVLDFLGA